MIRYEPTSFSTIARAQYIIAVRLVSVTASEWRPDEELALDKRDVAAKLSVERYWKGEPEPASLPAEGAVVELRFVQYAYRGPIRFKLPGVWSQVAMIEGERHFLFLLAASLEEPYLFLVTPQAIAEPDLALAELSGCPQIRLGELLQKAAPNTAQFGALFDEYVASRLKETFFAYPADYHLYFRIMESAIAPMQLRWIWLREAIAGLALHDPAPAVFVARTVFGCLQLAVDGGEDLRNAILKTYLPNLLGLQGGMQYKAAGDVFEGLPNVRQQSRNLLTENPALPDRERLLQWLQA